MNKIQKQREIISSLLVKKELATGQEKLDITTAIVDAKAKLNRMLYPKRFKL